jgi:signal transduction histidine kinase
MSFLAWQLRPAALDDFGLTAALTHLVSEWSAHVGIPAECRLVNFDDKHLTRERELAFYRITQEMLNNAAKHAHPSRVDVVLSTSGGQVSLVVEDDGVGFETSDAGLLGGGSGLMSMRERAALVGATLEIESVPGRGTSVFLRAPVAPPPRRRMT